MILTHTCSCCANTLLRHARLQGIYWFCAYCSQEMPILEALGEIRVKSGLSAIANNIFKFQASQTGRGYC